MIVRVCSKVVEIAVVKTWYWNTLDKPQWLDCLALRLERKQNEHSQQKDRLFFHRPLCEWIFIPNLRIKTAKSES